MNVPNAAASIAPTLIRHCSFVQRTSIRPVCRSCTGRRFSGSRILQSRARRPEFSRNSHEHLQRLGARHSVFCPVTPASHAAPVVMETNGHLLGQQPQSAGWPACLGALRYLVYFRFMDDVIYLHLMGHMQTCRYRRSELRHFVVVHRLTPLLRRIGCIVS